MKKTILIIFYFCLFAQAQGLHEMERAGDVVIPSIVPEPGGRFTLPQSFAITAEGSDKEVTVRKCTIKNIGMSTARLGLLMEVSDTSKHQSYFVSVGFYDKDKKFLMGHTFCSDYGQSFAGVRTDMQATEMSVDYLGGGVYLLGGAADLFVHQAMLYEEPAGGINPIKYCSVRIFHLLAG